MLFAGPKGGSPLGQRAGLLGRQRRPMPVSVAAVAPPTSVHEQKEQALTHQMNNSPS